MGGDCETRGARHRRRTTVRTRPQQNGSRTEETERRSRKLFGLTRENRRPVADAAERVAVHARRVAGRRFLVSGGSLVGSRLAVRAVLPVGGLVLPVKLALGRFGR